MHPNDFGGRANILDMLSSDTARTMPQRRPFNADRYSLDQTDIQDPLLLFLCPQYVEFQCIYLFLTYIRKYLKESFLVTWGDLTNKRIRHCFYTVYFYLHI